jgi:glycosyltransferase involved in cell wall biosynthesis
MSRPVSLYIIGFNEEANLCELLPTVKWADEILYVDSFSTDRSAAVCAEFGVRHVNVPFTRFGRIRNQALELLSHDWVVSIDTDERATPEFAAEVRETLADPKFDAYHVPRRNTFLGKPVRFGGMYPDYRQPQVFDRRKLRYRDDLVHEGFDCTGTIGYFRNFIWQHPWPTLSVAARKTDRYTALMARRKFDAGQRATVLNLVGAPLAGILRKYIIQQGFRDGIPGFILAGLHGYYTFLKYACLWELQNRPVEKQPDRKPES